MKVFIDTSAILAVLDADDHHHSAARREWEKIVSPGAFVICHNYVLVETIALVQQRLGLQAVRVLQEDVFPLIFVEWVDEVTHRMGMGALLAASRRRLSLVDCVSFEIMRKLGLRVAFAFDPHFREQGFHCLPK